MRDFFGQELAVGDYVAFELPKYRELTLGVVMAFTPKQVRLAYARHNPAATDSSGVLVHVDPQNIGWKRTFLTLPQTVVKKPENVEVKR